jgi:hypothetical protein
VHPSSADAQGMIRVKKVQVRHIDHNIGQLRASKEQLTTNAPVSGSPIGVSGAGASPSGAMPGFSVVDAISGVLLDGPIMDALGERAAAQDRAYIAYQWFLILLLCCFQLLRRLSWV